MEESERRNSEADTKDSWRAQEETGELEYGSREPATSLMIPNLPFILILFHYSGWAISSLFWDAIGFCIKNKNIIGNNRKL